MTSGSPSARTTCACPTRSAVRCGRTSTRSGIATTGAAGAAPSGTASAPAWSSSISPSPGRTRGARRSAYDPAAPSSPHDAKNALHLGPGDEKLLELDPRIERRPTELLLRKRYASAFKGTNLHEMLTAQGVDTLIVTGLSTSHCVYATCRDATDSFRVIVPREAVGERCELFHEVNLLDIDLDLGDVVPVDAVLRYLATLGAERAGARR
jgi:nicotinamidase-related amidase